MLSRPTSLLPAVLLLAGLFGPFAAAQDDRKSTAAPDEAEPAAGRPEEQRAAAALSERHRKWLQEVDTLIQPKEREVFLSLTKDYQREAFIERFWRVRDPFPQTTRNELRDQWLENLQLAGQLYDDLSSDKAQMLLFNGEATDVHTFRCSDYLYPIEAWFYEHTFQVRSSFYLVFYKPLGRGGDYKLWYPAEGLQPILAPRFGARLTDLQVLEGISATCPRGEVIVEALTRAVDWNLLQERVDLVPDPGEEWVRTFVAYSTDLPEGAETFPAEVEISFPGRYQSRTLVQALVTVALDEAETSELSDTPAYNFVLDGEILLRDALFEHFRYRFNLTEPQAHEGALPLVVQRHLRPGSYTLVLKMEDLNAERFFRQSYELEVPRVDPATIQMAAAAEELAPTRGAKLLEEANADLGTGDLSVKLQVPLGVMVVGKVRVDALVEGGESAEADRRVHFILNDKPVFSKSRPPYSVEVDLGQSPSIHTLRANVTDREGKVLASDEVVINAGPHRFAVRLIEPQRGKTYSRSVRASAVVERPEGEALDRVELYLNETKVATLYQPPFVQPMLIPHDEPVSYVRAVAYLQDGNSTEDAVFVNAPDYVDEVRVKFVELYTSVLDKKGRPVEGLQAGDFRVFEDGAEQTVRRFEKVENVPIHAGIVLDVSRSMLSRLDSAVKGALRFFETVLEPKDRAAVITFNETPHLAVRFTNDMEVLAGGLAGLTAEGDTALYDSLVYALYYFSGLTGKRAIVLLSDGEDVRSRYTFSEVIEYARRTGVSVYSIGLNLSGSKENDIRLQLERLARETGGSAYFIEHEGALERIYEEIQHELRSQYMLAYQSPGQGGDYRAVKVEVAQPGLEAKTIHGYFP